MDNKYKNYRILITGGHATPAVACINELKNRGYQNFIYIGQKKSLLFDKNPSSEYKLITESIQIPFKSLIAGKFSLFFNINSLIWLLRLPIGFIQAFFYHLTLRPRIILTFGSHVGIPVVFWGWVFRTPIIVHEQTVTLGRSNKFIQRFATKVCYSWQKVPENHKEAKKKDFKKLVNTTKFFYTGNPILEVKTDVFRFADTKKPVIFVTGGNQGAHAINEFIFESIIELSKKYNIIHQTGSNTIYNDFQKAQSLASELNAKGIVYIPVNYIFVEEMAEAYQKSFVVISRAGANTVTELLALKKKSILIPIPTTSGNEQFIQAKFLEDWGLGIVLNQSELQKTDLRDGDANCKSPS
jgi:UDP-N-acetylglucosamine--N-acetylmuramyl-(pentapeptide) pyrophosphoryl-undecaprenol N-acetylglucosamine transferase